MWKYLKAYECHILKILGSDKDFNWEKILNYHQKMIKRMQHERSIHLAVTLTFALFLILWIGYTALFPNITGLLMLPLLLIMTAAYIIHYFHLENGVQRWYYYSDLIEEKIEGEDFVVSYKPVQLKGQMKKHVKWG